MPNNFCLGNGLSWNSSFADNPATSRPVSKTSEQIAYGPDRNAQGHGLGHRLWALLVARKLPRLSASVVIVILFGCLF